MSRVLSKAWREMPITTACLTVATTLFIAVQLLGIWLFDDSNDALWRLGKVSSLIFVEKPPLNGLHGFIDLWDGQLWRIPVSAFHHGDLLHIVMNGAAIWFLGRLLEPRMRPVGYANFLLMAALVSMLPEFLLENEAIGLSGVAYAMFGMLLVVRRHDEDVASIFHEGIIQFGFVWLFICIPLTHFDILRIANLAHFLGLAYGWTVGVVFFSPRLNQRFVQRSFFATHLLVLVPALYLVMHPFWIGRYHWYLSRRAETAELKLHHLKNALSWDRGLPVLWRNLAEHQLQNGNMLTAWKTMLEALDYNRSDDEGVEWCRKLWKQIPTVQQRQRALEILRQVFREEEISWQQRLGILSKPGTLFSDRGDELPFREQSAPPVDPESPYSAVLDMAITL